MAFQIGSTNEHVTLELEGDNSVEQVAELHQQLLAAGAQSKTVSVEVQHCGAIDITVIQVLASLQSCCPEFRINRPSEEFLASFDRCSMRRHIRAALRQETRPEGAQP
jgi:ABC-type transporter Mla MlaB component